MVSVSMAPPSMMVPLLPSRSVNSTIPLMWIRAEESCVPPAVKYSRELLSPLLTLSSKLFTVCCSWVISPSALAIWVWSPLAVSWRLAISPSALEICADNPVAVACRLVMSPSALEIWAARPAAVACSWVMSPSALEI